MSDDEVASGGDEDPGDEAASEGADEVPVEGAVSDGSGEEAAASAESAIGSVSADPVGDGANPGGEFTAGDTDDAPSLQDSAETAPSAPEGLGATTQAEQPPARTPEQVAGATLTPVTVGGSFDSYVDASDSDEEDEEEDEIEADEASDEEE